MAEGLTLVGFEHSVYTWVVRLALSEMGLKATYVEANPFANPPDPVLTAYTPLRRVPVLQHNGFRLTETQAILRYLDSIQTGPLLQPDDKQAAAQMAQVMGLVDADVYPIMVRQVFSHGAYYPQVLGEDGSREAVAAGLEAVVPVLSVLEGIAGDGRVLGGASLTLADLHLGPMLSYFLRVAEGRALLRDHPALERWWLWISSLPGMGETDPLPQVPCIA